MFLNRLRVAEGVKWLIELFFTDLPTEQITLLK